MLQYIKKCEGNQQLVTTHKYWLQKYSFTVKMQIQKSLEHTRFLPLYFPCKHYPYRFIKDKT